GISFTDEEIRLLVYILNEVLNTEKLSSFNYYQNQYFCYYRRLINSFLSRFDIKVSVSEFKKPHSYLKVIKNFSNTSSSLIQVAGIHKQMDEKVAQLIGYALRKKFCFSCQKKLNKRCASPLINYESFEDSLIKGELERKRISILERLGGGKNAFVYLVKHPSYGRVVAKILPNEIGIHYGVKERFKIAQYFYEKLGKYSYFPQPFKLISLERGKVALIEEMIEGKSKEEMEKNLSFSQLQFLQVYSLVDIWRRSFSLEGFEGLVVRDIISSDLRFIKINKALEISKKKRDSKRHKSSSSLFPFSISMRDELLERFFNNEMVWIKYFYRGPEMRIKLAKSFLGLKHWGNKYVINNGFEYIEFCSAPWKILNRSSSSSPSREKIVNEIIKEWSWIEISVFYISTYIDLVDLSLIQDLIEFLHQKKVDFSKINSVLSRIGLAAEIKGIPEKRLRKWIEEAVSERYFFAEEEFISKPVILKEVYLKRGVNLGLEIFPYLIHKGKLKILNDRLILKSRYQLYMLFGIRKVWKIGENELAGIAAWEDDITVFRLSKLEVISSQKKRSSSSLKTPFNRPVILLGSPHRLRRIYPRLGIDKDTIFVDFDQTLIKQLIFLPFMLKIIKTHFTKIINERKIKELLYLGKQVLVASFKYHTKRDVLSLYKFFEGLSRNELKEIYKSISWVKINPNFIKVIKEIKRIKKTEKLNLVIISGNYTFFINYVKTPNHGFTPPFP
ncbi:MAG: hypothetical protein B6D56_05665, partial [Candidatus Omnitrophica bacterium 4484_70.1]